MSKERLQREAEFHDKTFGEHTRKVVKKYYDTAKISKEKYREKILAYGANQKVLEYGCGPGSQAFTLAEKGASVTAIDISNVAIEKGENEAKSRELAIDFRVMNAENLEFPDNSFDLVCGSGILHHLDLKQAYKEISRVLTSNGRAIFYEPLGHNPIINMYRQLTPNLRTEDEHPLLLEDIELAHNYFDKINIDYFHLTSMGASFLNNGSLKNSLLNFLNRFDNVLLDNFPPIRKHAWVCVLEFKKCIQIDEIESIL